jgi:hypothetical protein
MRALRGLAFACIVMLGRTSLGAQGVPDTGASVVDAGHPAAMIPTARMLAAPGFLLPVERVTGDPPLDAGIPLPGLVGLPRGQRFADPDTPARAAAELGGTRVGITLAPAAVGVRRAGDNPWWVPLASAAIPGAGQARLGQDRFIAYLALESFLWARYAADRREALRERAAYRRVATRVSRAGYPGDKPVGDFEYYERMEDWIASGDFDRDPGTATLEPEIDETTYNGAMWLLARKTYWPSPNTPPPAGSAAAVAALRFYEESAIKPEFQWSWRDARYEQDVFRRHIRASNEAFRHAIEDIGVVIANHVLSTVDAYISLRLRAAQAPDTREDFGLTAAIPWAPTHPSPQPVQRKTRP